MARIKAVVALLLLSLSSCAPATRHLSRAATQGAVEGVADAVAKHPEAQRKIADNLDEGAIRVGVERSSAGVIDGALDSLEEPARRERINKEVAAITASLVSTLVSSAGNAALSDANQQKVAAMTAGLVRLLKSELLPDQETVAKMMPVVRELVKNMTLGFQDAIDETQAKRNAGELPAGQGSVLWAAGEAAESSNEVLYMLGAGAVVLALAGIVVGVWAFRSAKANKAELAERDEAMLLMAEAIKSTESKPWSAELRSALREKLRGSPSSEQLRKLLRDKPALRLQAQRPVPPGAKVEGRGVPQRSPSGGVRESHA